VRKKEGETGGKLVMKAGRMMRWVVVVSAMAPVAVWVGVMPVARAVADAKTEEGGKVGELRVVKSLPGGGK
jgi:hypothetical protein